MTHKIADIPLESLTATEIGMLERMTTRYSEIMQKHAYLMGLMSLAKQAGDTKLLATTKKQLAEVEKQRKECFSELETERRDEAGAAARATEDGHAAA